MQENFANQISIATTTTTQKESVIRFFDGIVSKR